MSLGPMDCMSREMLLSHSVTCHRSPSGVVVKPRPKVWGVPDAAPFPLRRDCGAESQIKIIKLTCWESAVVHVQHESITINATRSAIAQW